jgi:hypothetical protein
MFSRSSYEAHPIQDRQPARRCPGAGSRFAALRESNDFWDNGLFTLTLGVLLVSILQAVHRSEAKRAFWVGFALFGSGYLALSLIPSIEPRLMTTKGLAYLDSRVPGRSLGFSQYSLLRLALEPLAIRSRMWRSRLTGINLPPPAQVRCRFGMWRQASFLLAGVVRLRTS